MEVGKRESRLFVGGGAFIKPLSTAVGGKSSPPFAAPVESELFALRCQLPLVAGLDGPTFGFETTTPLLPTQGRDATSLAVRPTKPSNALETPKTSRGASRCHGQRFAVFTARPPTRMKGVLYFISATNMVSM